MTNRIGRVLLREKVFKEWRVTEVEFQWRIVCEHKKKEKKEIHFQLKKKIRKLSLYGFFIFSTFSPRQDEFILIPKVI